MTADLTPLSGRASLPSIEFAASYPKTAQPETIQIKQKNSRVSIAKARVKNAVAEFFLRFKTTRFVQPSLAGYRISYQTTAEPLIACIVKTAQGEYRSFLKQMTAGRRPDVMQHYWSTLKVEFQKLYLAIVRKNKSAREPFSNSRPQ